MRDSNRFRLQSVVAMILLAFVFTSATSFADSIKERMKTRLPEIKELKASGVVGEDNKGLLFVRSVSQKATTLVQEENVDRQKVYSFIANKTGATADLVGHSRAVKIAAKAASGVWLQDSSGKWYQK